MVLLEHRIKAFVSLGRFIESYLSIQESEISAGGNQQLLAFNADVTRAMQANAWFTIENIQLALSSIRGMLHEEKLRRWLEDYSVIERKNPVRIGVVMAGNIPLVGFHDFLCVILSGHFFYGKLSSEDQFLLPALCNVLFNIEPALAHNVRFFHGKLDSFDAIIATGSNNTARYFDYYFGKYPHIIRQNRSGIAIIDGHEKEDDFVKLGKDVFSYFGLGCRNVSNLFIPKGYDFSEMLNNFVVFDTVKQHSKYFNNYLYNKSLLLINKEYHLDNGFVLLVHRETLSSPISVLHFQYYDHAENLAARIASKLDHIQCIVSRNAHYNGSFDFGEAQKPGVQIYADGIDTMNFLINLGMKE